MRGNVVELAVAVVVGTAFSKIVDAVVNGVINPIVGALGPKNLDEYEACLKSPCTVDSAGETTGVLFKWGSVLSASLTFLITAAVVYFLMIVPMNKYKERQLAKQGETPPEPTEIELLTEIRDALLAKKTEGASQDGEAQPVEASVSGGVAPPRGEPDAR
ncbi:MscL family protein [Streptomyces sp. XM4193]|uniref:MscL family protein n=1 Tax=Streptomyces sp. XM4193 TaxID=2929782 RepID=UPI001FF7A1BF|nr:MscL family protein [Streptomyces sp. XM4193]MCK1796792.1 MscL family protein [Streptomyces sp. XM4193]